MKNTDIIIIGAGPAGLFAAIHCPPGKAIVLERNPQPGKKLLISGSGRCNITHDEDIHQFFNRYGNKEKFIRQVLKAYTNDQLMTFFLNNGLGLVADKNQKVFPENQDAMDVLRTLMNACARNKVPILTGQRVSEIHHTGTHFELTTQSETYRSVYLVVATGGKSYPATGSTGDGYEFARSMGHTVVKPKPALSPVFVKDFSFSGLAGNSLEDSGFSVFRNGKKIHEFKGTVGFTHKGLSGPAILDNSRYLEEGDILKINFPGINQEEFRNQLIDAGRTAGKTAVVTWLKRLNLPKNLLRKLLEMAGISQDTLMAELTKQQRNTLLQHLCSFPFEIERIGGFKVAMVTTGGISLDEISPRTMESSIIPGLYFIGETIDIDGDTGGYNLQAAFSTGYIAAQSIAKKLSP